MNSKIEYVGKDLEAMDFAVNYHRWILELIKPYLGSHLVEVGAGTGSFSELLLECMPESLMLVEPSEMYGLLNAKDFSKDYPGTEIRTFHHIFVKVAEEIQNIRSPDSIIYINVLEHIEEDLHELKLVNQTLSKNGRVIIFVPALQSLFSDFDKHIGHFRRYTKPELSEKCRSAGFEISFARYFDFPGILPWFVNYRLLKSLKMGSGMVRIYDKFVVPVAKLIERIATPPIGKNLLLIAEKKT